MLDPRLWENAVYPVCSGPFIPERWGLYSVQRALHPKKVTFAQYEASPSLSQGRNLPNVQPVPHSWEMMFTLCVCVTQCATSPSTFLRDYYAMGPSALTRPENEVYPVCNVQWAPHSSLCDEVYPKCSEVFVPETWGLDSVQQAPHPQELKFAPCAASLTLSQGWSLHSVQPAPHPWEIKFNQCATSPSSLPRDYVFPVCYQPFITLERWRSPGVQWAPPL